MKQQARSTYHTTIGLESRLPCLEERLHVENRPSGSHVCFCGCSRSGVVRQIPLSQRYIYGTILDLYTCGTCYEDLAGAFDVNARRPRSKKTPATQYLSIHTTQASSSSAAWARIKADAAAERGLMVHRQSSRCLNVGSSSISEAATRQARRRTIGSRLTSPV